MTEPTFVVMRYVPYEGDYEAFSGTATEISEWLKTCGVYRDDLTLYRTDGVPDIYTL